MQEFGLVVTYKNVKKLAQEKPHVSSEVKGQWRSINEAKCEGAGFSRKGLEASGVTARLICAGVPTALLFSHWPWLS